MGLDPAPGALAAAVQWLQGTLLGTVATTVAVIAVASVGLMMLSGRISIRRAGEVIVGCFIVFGASTITAGLQSAAGGTAEDVPVPQAMPSIRPTAPAPATGVLIDPYAGAAVPDRR
ncbi:MAG TPA: TrbC/VirB2 family protein [Allosphingosinicella sp.]